MKTEQQRWEDAYFGLVSGVADKLVVFESDEYYQRLGALMSFRHRNEKGYLPMSLIELNSSF